MSYYDHREYYDSRSIDYDLVAAFEYNSQKGLDVNEIAQVLAVYEGERDGEDWRWIVRTDSGRIAFIQGGCDYTGWDCQSWLTHAFAPTPEDAARMAFGENVPVGEHGPEQAGLGHTLSILIGTYLGKAQEVYDSLMKQLSDGKSKTWREDKDEELLDSPKRVDSSGKPTAD